MNSHDKVLPFYRPLSAGRYLCSNLAAITLCNNWRRTGLVTEWLGQAYQVCCGTVVVMNKRLNCSLVASPFSHSSGKCSPTGRIRHRCPSLWWNWNSGTPLPRHFAFLTTTRMPERMPLKRPRPFQKGKSFRRRWFFWLKNCAISCNFFTVSNRIAILAEWTATKSHMLGFWRPEHQEKAWCCSLVALHKS